MNKYFETLRESKRTVTALIALIVFWIVAGIVGSHVEKYVYNVPMWAVFGTLGVWTFAIVIAMTLSRNIKDSEL